MPAELESRRSVPMTGAGKLPSVDSSSSQHDTGMLRPQNPQVRTVAHFDPFGCPFVTEYRLYAGHVPGAGIHPHPRRRALLPSRGPQGQPAGSGAHSGDKQGREVTRRKEITQANADFGRELCGPKQWPPATWPFKFRLIKT